MQHLDESEQFALPLTEARTSGAQQSPRCILALSMLKTPSPPQAQWLGAPGCSNRPVSHAGGAADDPVAPTPSSTQTAASHLSSRVPLEGVAFWCERLLLVVVNMCFVELGVQEE
eukprot:scaffold11693_cov64-Phaeocystis_antarctica.AAC.1